MTTNEIKLTIIPSHIDEKIKKLKREIDDLEYECQDTQWGLELDQDGLLLIDSWNVETRVRMGGLGDLLGKTICCEGFNLSAVKVMIKDLTDVVELVESDDFDESDNSQWASLENKIIKDGNAWNLGYSSDCY
tara:strand:- start:28 stop:426 length:399 start_codon:yes stop_codon:yes gene_type:complete